jgi:hypothetical protein
LRDYAKRNSRGTKQAPESDGTGILVFLVICTLLFAGYATYHFTHDSAASKITTSAPVIITPTEQPIKKSFLHKVMEHKTALTHKINAHKEIAKKRNAKAIKKPVKKTAPINPADIQPKYDFYKMLPAMTVPIPKEDAPMLPSASVTAKNN